MTEKYKSHEEEPAEISSGGPQGVGWDGGWGIRAPILSDCISFQLKLLYNTHTHTLRRRRNLSKLCKSREEQAVVRREDFLSFSTYGGGTRTPGGGENIFEVQPHQSVFSLILISVHPLQSSLSALLCPH